MVGGTVYDLVQMQSQLRMKQQAVYQAVQIKSRWWKNERTALYCHLTCIVHGGPKAPKAT